MGLTERCRVRRNVVIDMNVSLVTAITTGLVESGFVLVSKMA
jgi:hypothetical protein